MAASKLKRFFSIALVGLMLTPIVSFATSDTSAQSSAEDETNTTTTTQTTTTALNANSSGLVKNETGIGFIAFCCHDFKLGSLRKQRWQ